ncbi:uncharacterized protein LOC132313573 isoform X2 [Cornus florida]|uniref:uncharacterized protein LOC132313573 isoform X2 n=1 Tax=Cornus florida TaxID=4283 RepID=UPI00289D2BC5|nr:uncharacterized protein LOC132313573 isoform X2 [Cornus florida]
MEDENENNVKKEVAETVRPEVDLNDDLQQHIGSVDIIQTNIGNCKGKENVCQGVAQADIDSSGEVNMEATILSDDVIRAGGFGARDDISSFLPVASDSTDFEASLLDARDYEEPQEKICRPGLGWTEATNGWYLHERNEPI